MRREPTSILFYHKKEHLAWAAEGRRREPACAVCGEAKGRLHYDHIVSVALLIRIGVRVAESYRAENGMTLCGTHHGVKTGADGHLWKGDLLGYLQILRTSGWNMERVEAALAYYGLLPTKSASYSTSANQ